MKRQKLVPVSKHLFRVYTLAFLAFFLVMAAATTFFLARTIDKYIIETQKNMTAAVSRSVDRYFSDMNEFSLELMNDPDFKQAVLSDLPRTLETGASQSAILQRVYNSAYKMIENGYRVGVVTKGGVYIWLGDKILVEQLEGQTGLYDDYNSYGSPVLKCMAYNPSLLQIPGGSNSTYSQEPVLTLSRSINLHNRFTLPQAMLEIQVSQKEFQSFMESVQGSCEEQLRICVYAGDGSCLFGDTDILDFPESLRTGNPTDWMRFQGDMVRADPVFQGGVQVVYAIPAAVYYEKLVLFLGVAAAFYGIMLIVMLIVSYCVSLKLTRPIQDVSRQLENISLTQPGPLPKVETNIYELDLMAQTVSQMDKKLTDTMQQMVIAQTAEMQSRLMALQSQMQPHFLYNTLAVIAGLSEQGNADAVSRMCRNLSQMLRYVSSKEDKGVTIYEEMLFLKCYLAIMQERFPQTQVRMDIPLDMMELRVPKLILQPLCENSFKYAGRNDVSICVHGQLEADRWTIRVTDNGSGFPQETIDTIMARCRRIFADKQALSTKIDGMGLVNIYARLALFFRDDFVFRIHPTEGITIGGTIDAAECEN